MRSSAFCVVCYGMGSVMLSSVLFVVVNFCVL